MQKSALSESGLYVDELNKIRVLEPDIAQETGELREECKGFIDKIGEFKQLVGGFLGLVEELGKEVDVVKVQALGARNLLKSVEKQREAQSQQLQALLTEKQITLERLRVQYEALQKEEATQKEFIEQFVLT